MSISSGDETVNPLTFVTNMASKVGSVITRPIVRMGEIFTIPEHEEDVEEDQSDEDTDLSLEGELYYRKGKSTKWRRSVVILKFQTGGTIECYRVNPNSPSKKLKDVYSKLHRQSSSTRRLVEDLGQEIVLFLGPESPWQVKDVRNDPSQFVIEIPTDDSHILKNLLIDGDSRDLLRKIERDSLSPNRKSRPGLLNEMVQEKSMSLANKAKLERDFRLAEQSKRPLRFYFKCPRKGNEKTLWLRGFAKLDRLAADSMHKRRLLGKLAHMGVGATSRIRREITAEFTRDARQLEMGVLSPQYRSSSTLNMHRSIEALARDNAALDRREFRVYPNYCYPHVWMTQSELKEECNLPSTKFHDQRIDAIKGTEIGLLRVEVLECMGLPKLDRKNQTDAVTYLVCGSYAFATDVIPSTVNPIWLRKARRAAVFPIFHGYARLFCGVFDDDAAKQEMAGRVVIDLAKLRPGSRYDVTLPLRLSAQVYTRRERGAIRLRFQLDWASEREALLSYLPTSLKIPKREDTSPDTRTTIMCTDAISFRNVVLTVHGLHPPGKFSFNHLRATLKEVNFTRKMTMGAIRGTIKDTMKWVNPSMSLFVFCAWMHCIKANSCGLVPAYTATFVMMHMFRNYAIYGMDGPSARGFVPPTWEEMLLAVAFGRPLEPLNMTAEDAGETTNGSQRSRAVAVEGSLKRTVETHVPKGKLLFRLLGFIGPEEDLSPNDHHLEFPFGDGKLYPKLSVKEALVKATQAKQAKETAKESAPLPSPRPSPRHISARSSLKSDGELALDKKMEALSSPESDDDDDEDDNDHRRHHDFTTEFGRVGSHDTDDAMIEYENGSFDVPGAFEEDTKPDTGKKERADQDIDLVVDSKGKTLVDEMVEVNETMHKFMWNNFHDKTHVVKDPDAVYFGQKGKKKDVNKDLQRSLGVGDYSHANPIMSRAGRYLTPILAAVHGFLALFRCIFNVFTWRDPFLSFWVSLFGIGICIILFLFPWRPFLFVLGVVAVGPQNWAIRVYRERKKQVEVPEVEDEAPETIYRLPTDQPLFKAHPPPDQKHTDVIRSKINPKAVHHVVVPYTPLMYSNRFYDWPPEAEYSHVKKKAPALLVKRGSVATRRNSVGNSVSNSNSSASDGGQIGLDPRLANNVPFVIDTSSSNESPPNRARARTADLDPVFHLPAATPPRRRNLSMDYFDTPISIKQSHSSSFFESPI